MINKPLKNLFTLLIAFTLMACSQSRTINTGATLEQTTSYQNANHIEKGKASFYADKYQGRKTASGQPFNQNALTAAHKTLRFGTKVRVIASSNGKTVIVTINDRGPFVKGRIIDLSKRAFSQIADQHLGLVDVIIEVLK